jgi:hypothetical protein
MELLNKIFDGESNVILSMLNKIFLSSLPDPQNLVIIKNVESLHPENP